MLEGFHAYVMFIKYQTYYHLFGLKLTKFWSQGNRSTDYEEHATYFFLKALIFEAHPGLSTQKNKRIAKRMPKLRI